MICFSFQSYKPSKALRTVFCMMFLTLFAYMPTSPSMAASVTIDDIDVDVSADNAVEAREKAFEEAQVKGYAKLAEKMLTEEELQTFEVPDINVVSRYVKDFEVSNEKLSATRYAGTYKIRYDASDFNQAQNQGGQAPQGGISSVKGSILILPFFEDAGYPMLWRTNPFMQAWLRARDNNAAAPSIVPRGDMEDISAIKDEEALQYNPHNLLMLKRRYQAPHAAILLATPELMPDGRQNLAIAIYQAKSYGPELAQQISVRSEVGESARTFYDRAVQQVNNVFKQRWKRKTAIAQQQSPQSNSQPALSGPVSTLIAQVGFNNMRQWVDTKKSIESTHGVRGLSVKSLSSRGATLAISYQGNVEGLRESLRVNGVGMNDGNGSIYQLSPSYGGR